jgi:hypothetical protein
MCTNQLVLQMFLAPSTLLREQQTSAAMRDCRMYVAKNEKGR